VAGWWRAGVLQLLKLPLDGCLDHARRQLSVEIRVGRRREVVEPAVGEQLVGRGGPRLHLRDPVPGTIEVGAHVARMRADARGGLVRPGLGLGGGVGGLEGLLFGAKRGDPFREASFVVLQLRLLPL